MITLRKARPLVVTVYTAVLTSLALAHHSTALFDMQKTVELNGTIREFQWTNPHTIILLIVEGDASSGGEYRLEGMRPGFLEREGWSRYTLRSGDQVSMQVHPLKDGGKGGFVISVTLPDGTVMYDLPPLGGVDPATPS